MSSGNMRLKILRVMPTGMSGRIRAPEEGTSPVSCPLIRAPVLGILRPAGIWNRP